MSETVTENDEVSTYLSAIRAALNDLEPADRDDLLEDLEAHLHEVLSEFGGASLESSLGSPAAYAAELRASAGLEPGPVGPPPLRRRIEAAVAASTMGRVGRSLLASPAAREFVDVVRSLRPAWWVVRGWLALVLAVVVVEYRRAWSGGARRWVFVPAYHSHVFVGVFAVAVAVLLSVWLGRRSSTSRTLRAVSVVGNALLLLLTAFVSPRLAHVVLGPRYSFSGAASAPYRPVDGLRLNGRQIVNIYPYDEQGHPLQGVRLYDDQGRPLQGLATQTDNGMPIVRVLPTDAAGAHVKNEYPQQASVQTPAYADPVASMAAAASGQAWAMPSAQVSVFVPGLAIPAPAIVVPPLPGATATPVPSATPTATPTPSTTPNPSATPPTPKGTKTSSAASKATTRAPAGVRSGAGGSTARTP